MTGDPEGGFAEEQAEAAAAVLEGTCLPLPALDVSGLGDLPVFGVVPAFVPADPVAWYPDGVVPAPRVLEADLPPIRARFTRQPTVSGPAAALQPVVDTLVDEAAVAWDRERLARRLFALATLLSESEGAEDLAAEALRCAVADEPGHVLARFALEALLTGRPETGVERVSLLEQVPDVSAAHRAGHVARRQVGDAAWALDLWWSAAERFPGQVETLLASYLHHLETGDEQAGSTLAEMLYQGVQGRRFWGVLAADRIARARPYWPVEQLRADVLATRERAGVSPALVAVGEELALSTGDTALARALIEGRIAEPGVEPAELAILWARLAWLHEQAGEEEAAREACEKAISQGDAPSYARRRALALARRQGSHALIHRLQSARAEDARLPVEERAAALIERAAADFALDRAAEGRTALARAVELDRTYRPALAALGRAALELDDVTGQLQLFAAELTALEERGEASPRVADRAVRLALMRARAGRDLASALDACRRALAAAPADRDAFLVGADILGRLGQWAALAALYARRAGQPGVGPDEAVEYLGLAAGLFHGRLGEATQAARLVAQALRLVPQHPGLLLRGADIFARAGQRRAWAEVEARLETPARAARAGRLFEVGEAAEHPAAAAAFAAAGTSAIALDGRVRAAVRSGEVTGLAEVPPEALRWPLVRLTWAEALLAGGRPDAALEVLADGSIAADNTLFYQTFLDLRGIAAVRTGRWSVWAETLVEQAARLAGTARADLLVRAGEVRALREGDVAGAVALFEQALAAAPESGPAQQALTRWRVSAAPAEASELAAAAAARRAGDWERHDALLRSAAERDTRTAEASGLRRASGAGDLEAPPHRDDLFKSGLRSVATPADRVEHLARRAREVPPASRPPWLRRQIAACLSAADWSGAEGAARQLLELEPGSVTAGLALARVAACTGQARHARDGLAILAAGVEAPAHREAVAEAQARVAADPLAEVRALVAAGQVVEASVHLSALSPSVDVWRLRAEVAEKTGDRTAAAAARAEAFQGLEGAEAATEALLIAGLLQAVRPAEAAEWLQRAVLLDPRQAGRAVFSEGTTWSLEALEEVGRAIQVRLEAGGLVPEELADLAQLRARAGDAVGAELARQAAEYVGAEVAGLTPVALPLATLQPEDWDRHVRDAGEATPAGALLALVVDPLAAALAGPPMPGLKGAERWQEALLGLFERLAAGRPRLGLAPDARWGARLTPAPMVLAPAREAPLDEPARFTLGGLAAGFSRGRLLLQAHGAAVLAGAIAALRRGVTGDNSLISLEDPLTMERRARLAAAAGALGDAERAALSAAGPEAISIEAIEALTEPFQATARRAGVLACGELPAALDAVLGRGGGSPRARRLALAGSPPALALVAWALSADHRALLAREGAE